MKEAQARRAPPDKSTAEPRDAVESGRSSADGAESGLQRGRAKQDVFRQRQKWGDLDTRICISGLGATCLQPEYGPRGPGSAVASFASARHAVCKSVQGCCREVRGARRALRADAVGGRLVRRGNLLACARHLVGQRQQALGVRSFSTSSPARGTVAVPNTFTVDWRRIASRDSAPAPSPRLSSPVCALLMSWVACHASGSFGRYTSDAGRSHTSRTKSLHDLRLDGRVVARTGLRSSGRFLLSGSEIADVWGAWQPAALVRAS